MEVFHCSEKIKQHNMSTVILAVSYFILFYLFFEKGEGSEKERKRNINVWLPLMHPPLGT